jgi:hypothetical protein
MLLVQSAALLALFLFARFVITWQNYCRTAIDACVHDRRDLMIHIPKDMLLVCAFSDIEVMTLEDKKEGK